MDLIRSPGATPVTVDCWPHPITTEGRATLVAPLPPDGSLTLIDVIREHWHGPPDLAVAHVDGRLIERGEWPCLHLRPGQVVRLSARVLGGGGDSNPLQIVLQIAVAAVAFWAPYAAPAAWGTLTAAGGVSFTGALLSAGIMLAGNLVLGEIFPAPEPSLPTSTPSPEPVYSLRAGRNRLRPYEPLLLLLGQHRLYPDLAAQPYTTYEGGAHGESDDEQHLHQVFHLGVGAPGDLEVSDWRIGDSPLASYGVADPPLLEGTRTSLRSDVDTVAGGTLEGTDPDGPDGMPGTDDDPEIEADDPGPWVKRVTSEDTDRIELDLTGRIFRVDRRGAVIRNSVGIEARVWPYVAGAALPDAPPGSAVAVAETLSHDESSPYRKTLVHTPAAAGQYHVWMRRQTQPSTDDRTYDDVEWAALRSYQPESGDYTHQVRVELSLEASGQLQGSLDRLSCLAARRVPVFAGGAWGAAAKSSNPAALLRWYALGLLDAGRPVAGMGLAQDQIDHATLGRWHQWCETQGLTCDLVLDRQASHQEVLDIICRCGRAGWTFESGKLGVVWEEQRPPTASYSPGNIVQGSLEVSWVTGGAADEIVVDYIDADDGYETSTVRRRTHAAGLVATSVRIRLPGITSRDLAGRAANVQAARQKYHRRRIRWRTGPEGQYVARGDVVYLSHSLLDGGVTGRVLSGTTTDLALSRPVTLTGDDYLLVRTADGQVHTSRVTPTTVGEVETAEVTLASPLPWQPGAHGGDAADWLWRYYSGTAPPRQVRVIGKVPYASGEYELTATDEVPEYYAADVPGTVSDLPALRRDPPHVLAVRITETLVRAGTGYAARVEILITARGDWRGGVVYAARQGAHRERVAVLSGGETRAAWITSATGVHLITIIPGTPAAASGLPYHTRYTVMGVYALPGPIRNFRLDPLPDGTRRLHWEAPDDVDYAGALIRYHPTVAGGGTQPEWDAAGVRALYEGSRRSPYETVDPPEGGWTFRARAVDTGGRLSATEAVIHASLGPPRGQDVLVWSCPADEGWPGAIAGGIRDDQGADALEGAAAYTWQDLTTWGAWLTWGAGTGSGAGRAMSYTTLAQDLGTELTFGLAWSGEVNGISRSAAAPGPGMVFEARAAATQAALAAAGWTAYGGGKLTGRYYQLRWRLAGDGSTILRLDHLCYSVLAPTSTEILSDSDPSAWATARVGDVAPGLTLTPAPSGAGKTGADTLVYRVPLQTLAVCSDLDLTVQYRGTAVSPSSRQLSVSRDDVLLPIVVAKTTRTEGGRDLATVWLDLRGRQDDVLLDIVARGIARSD